MAELFSDIEKTEYPLVSIVSPCYNGEKYIERFLNSVLAQTYPSIELILVDDGSEDHTSEIVKTYVNRFANKHFGFLFLQSEKNCGAAAAINMGLCHVHGKYFMWADSDDILYPDNVKEKVSYLISHPDAEFVLCQQISVDENDLTTPLRIWKRTVSNDYDPMIEDLLLGRNVVYGPGTVLVYWSSFEKAIPSKSIYESRHGQNFQLMIPLAYCCRWGYLDKVLVKYVIHQDSHSNYKRTYSESVLRQRGFLSIVEETLSHIPEMTIEDYERYMKIAEQQFYGKELQIALQYGRLFHYCKVRSLMKQNGLEIKRNQKPIFFYGKYIKRAGIELFNAYKKLLS